MRRELSASIAAAVLVAASIATPSLGAQQWGASVAYSAVGTSARELPPYYEGPGGYVHPIILERPSFSAGVTYRAPLSRRTRVQPELWLFDKGGADVRRIYLEAPVVLQYAASADGDRRWAPVLTLGVAPALLLYCRSPRELYSPGMTENCADSARVSTRYATRRLDVGLVGGAGVELRRVGGSVLSLDLRLSLGRRNVGYMDGWRFTNHALSLVLGVRPAR